MTSPSVICTLDDVKSSLQIPSTDSTRDAMLQTYIDAATTWVNFISGTVLPQTFIDETHDGGTSTIVLFNAPILSVASVTEYWGITAYPLTASERGGAITTYGYSVDNPAAGTISRVRSGAVGPFVAGDSNIVVTYTAGYATVPADIRLAVMTDIQGLWTQQQYGGNLSGEPNDGDQWSVPPMSAFPRLSSLLTSSRKVQTIA